MSREVKLALVARVSDDGTRCAAECPHVELDAFHFNGKCTRFNRTWWPADDIQRGNVSRHPACIAAEVSTVEGES